MNLYIHGYGVLSAAGSSDDKGFLQHASDQPTDQLLCKEPDYSGYIAPMQLRRMSKAVRMGIGASKICLQQADLDKPDAISVGTAMGCLHDTEVFLSRMIDQEEQMLTPTAFIQSTHNTVAGQIALITGCHGHNLTYVHRGHSFEHAVLNTQLYLDGHKDACVLAGGIDELIDASKTVMQRCGIYADKPLAPAALLEETQQDSIAGEGASFFAMRTVPADKYHICIRDVYTFIAADTEEAVVKTTIFTDRLGIASSAVDALVLGLSGDERYAAFYERLRASVFNNVPAVAFKHLSGEYATASAFALGLVCRAVQSGFPESAILDKHPGQLKHVVIVNHFDQHYSCWYIAVG